MDEPLNRKFIADYSYTEDGETKNGTLDIQSTSITGAFQKAIKKIPADYKIIQINIREVYGNS